MVVEFASKFWYFSQVLVRVDFNKTITIRSHEYSFLQRVTEVPDVPKYGYCHGSRRGPDERSEP